MSGRVAAVNYVLFAAAWVLLAGIVDGWEEARGAAILGVVMAPVVYGVWAYATDGKGEGRG